MRYPMPIAMAALSAALAAPSAQAARVTECTAINICYCVETDIKPAIDHNIGKIRQAIAEQKSFGRASGYMSLPISNVGGACSASDVTGAANTRDKDET